MNFSNRNSIRHSHESGNFPCVILSEAARRSRRAFYSTSSSQKRGSIRFILTFTLFFFITACTDYVQQMDDGFEEWEKAQKQSAISSSTNSTDRSSSSSEKNESISSSSKVSQSSNSDKNSSSSEKTLSSSSEKKNESSSSNKVSSSSDQKNKSSSSIKTTSSSSNVTSSTSTNSCSSSIAAFSSSNESTSSSSSSKASWAYLNPAISYGEMTDNRDGQVYKTVKIGEQTWIAENLNFETENSYCYNDSTKYCDKYGRLYIWFAAKDACPPEWHLPDKNDFVTLLTSVGGDSVAGKMLKSKTGWNRNGNGSDAYSFSAISAGCRNNDGKFNGEGANAFFWSSSENNNASNGGVYFLDLFDNVDKAYLSDIDKKFGFSVRCIKDEKNTPKSSSSVFSSSTSKESWAYLNPAISYGEITDDRDGQVYKTVKIGSQTWMAENLNFKTTTSYCYDDRTRNCEIEGRLYTWAEAMDSAGTFTTKGKGCGLGKTCSPTYPVRGMCPKGWHLPTRVEWQTLISSMDDPSTAGSMLKSTSGWYNDGNGSNAYGFSIRPAGSKQDDEYLFKGSQTFLWSSTEFNSTHAYNLGLSSNSPEIFQNLYNDQKNYGRSVRCIKD